MPQLKKVGFIINSLKDLTERAINSLNKLAHDLEHSVTVFVSKYELPSANPMFSILNHTETFSYDGILISTNLETTFLLKNCWTTRNRFYYIHKFEYDKEYKINRDIYSCPNIQYITNNTTDFENLYNIWGQGSKIIREYNYEQIRDLVKMY